MSRVGLGACVAAAFARLVAPGTSPWGVAAGLPNRMPFVGAAVVTLGVGTVGFEDRGARPSLQWLRWLRSSR